MLAQPFSIVLLQQGSDTVFDHLLHRHQGACAFDAGSPEDLPGDSIEVIGVSGYDLDEGIGCSADTDDLENFGDPAQRLTDLVES